MGKDDRKGSHATNGNLTRKDVKTFAKVSRYFCLLASLVPAYFLMSGSIMVGGTGVSMALRRSVSLAKNPREFCLVLGLSILVSIGFWIVRAYLLKGLARQVPDK
jgi:hypothetical protein